MNLKHLILSVVVLTAGGQILTNAEEHNKQHPLVYVAQAQVIEPEVVLIESRIDWTEERIKKEVEEQAKQHNVPAAEMWGTILCESGASTTIQSYHIRKDGTREQSFGLSQIHLPDHPTVTKEQAIDPKFAINFMAKNWHKVRWYCRD